MKNTNNEIFAKNLKFYMEQKKVDRYQLCEALGFKYSTVSEWLSANKYPRMDKIEMLAKYFDVNKSDLIEEHSKKRFIKREIITSPGRRFHIIRGKKVQYQEEYAITGINKAGKSAMMFPDKIPQVRQSPEILTYYEQLNDLGQQEAIKRVKELTYLPDYKKSDDDKTDTPVPDLLTTKK